MDLNGALVLMALLLVLPAAIPRIGDGFMQAMTNGFRDIPQDAEFGTVINHIGIVLKPCLMGLGFIMGAVIVVGLVSNFAQVGFVLSGEALMPKLSKLNPANGLKRLFSRQATFDGFKATVKSGLFMYIGWTAIQGSWIQLTELSTMPPGLAMATVAGIVRAIALRIAFVWLVLAGLDYFFQKKQVDKQLKMTKEELKQEMKESETSPELKMAQAARRRKLAKGRMMDAVKTADVIVTNPTHFAVAIKYEPGKAHAPIVVAKGADFLAAKIREAAGDAKVPIVPNPPLARALYKQCEIGDFVPRELFQAVAEVLAFVYRTLRKVSTHA